MLSMASPDHGSIYVYLAPDWYNCTYCKRLHGLLLVRTASNFMGRYLRPAGHTEMLGCLLPVLQPFMISSYVVSHTSLHMGRIDQY